MDGKPLIGEDVAVFGQGIVGLLTTGLLARIPLASLISLDRFPMRRRVSREMGAKVCLDPEDVDLQKKLAEYLPNGADLTYEVSGSPAALDQALAATGFAGRIVIGSWHRKIAKTKKIMDQRYLPRPSGCAFSWPGIPDQHRA